MISPIPRQDIEPLAMVIVILGITLVIIPRWFFQMDYNKQLKTIEQYKQLNPHHYEQPIQEI